VHLYATALQRAPGLTGLCINMTTTRSALLHTKFHPPSLSRHSNYTCTLDKPDSHLWGGTEQTPGPGGAVQHEPPSRLHHLQTHTHTWPHTRNNRHVADWYQYHFLTNCHTRSFSGFCPPVQSTCRWGTATGYDNMCWCANTCGRNELLCPTDIYFELEDRDLKSFVSNTHQRVMLHVQGKTTGATQCISARLYDDQF